MSKGIIRLVYGWSESSDDALYLTRRFRLLFDPKLIHHEYCKYVLYSVDKTAVVDTGALYSEVFGFFPMERMSGGAKALIYSYFHPNDVYPMPNLGDNCGDALYRGSLDVMTSWYFDGYLLKMHPEQQILLPDNRVVVYKEVQSWRRTLPTSIELGKMMYHEED